MERWWGCADFLLRYDPKNVPPFYLTAPVAQKLMFQNHMMLYIIGREILRWRNFKKGLIPKNASSYWIKYDLYIPLIGQKPDN